MPTLRRSVSAYVSFLEIGNLIQVASPLPPLDPLEERIFRIVARIGYENNRLSVRDLMALHEIGAPRTIHSRLKAMRRKGWIAFTDTKDAQRKQVEPTEAALRFLDLIGGRISEVAKRHTS
jgi:hypothetical protein